MDKVKISFIVTYDHLTNKISVGNDWFLIDDIEIREGKYGKFLAMPSKYVDGKWQKIAELHELVCEKVIEKMESLKDKLTEDQRFELNITEKEYFGYVMWNTQQPDMFDYVDL